MERNLAKDTPGQTSNDCCCRKASNACPCFDGEIDADQAPVPLSRAWDLVLDAALAAVAGPTRHVVIQRDVDAVADGAVPASDAIDVIREEMAGWGITVEVREA